MFCPRCVEMKNRRTFAALLSALVVGVPGAQMLFTIRAQAAPYINGDLMVSLGDGTSGNQVNEYKPDGTLMQTLTTFGVGPGGSRFDANGNFYVADFRGQTVDKFDANGASAGTFGGGYGQRPESILFDRSGNAYVGQASSSGFDCGTSCPILKFDSAGNSLASYTPVTENRGTDWIELDADQCTLYYTSEGTSVMRFNVCTNSQL